MLSAVVTTLRNTGSPRIWSTELMVEACLRNVRAFDKPGVVASSDWRQVTSGMHWRACDHLGILDDLSLLLQNRMSGRRASIVCRELLTSDFGSVTSDCRPLRERRVQPDCQPVRGQQHLHDRWVREQIFTVLALLTPPEGIHRTIDLRLRRGRLYGLRLLQLGRSERRDRIPAEWID
jgi:hypothetical protein